MKHAVYKTAVAIVAMMAAGSFASAGAAPLGGNRQAIGQGRNAFGNWHHPEQHQAAGPAKPPSF
jgi:hypothetical protein